MPDHTLASIILRAAEIHEQSWTCLPAASIPGYGEYQTDNYQAADLASVELIGTTAYGYPVGLLLHVAWNDIIAWAEWVIAGKATPFWSSPREES